MPLVVLEVPKQTVYKVAGRLVAHPVVINQLVAFATMNRESNN
jgi:hypothetical protein